MILKFDVPNWDQYNPRKDRTKHCWLRLENDYFHGTKVRKMPIEAKMIFLYICCERSRLAKETIEIDAEAVEFYLGVKKDDFLLAALRLHSENMLFLHDDEKVNENIYVPACPQKTPRGSPTNERTNVTNERTVGVAGSQGDLLPLLSDATLPEFDALKEFFAGRKISLDVQRRWLKVFGKEFTVHEVKALDLWAASNPQKAPKSNWSSFFSRNLLRSWEKKRHFHAPGKPGNDLSPAARELMKQGAK